MKKNFLFIGFGSIGQRHFINIKQQIIDGDFYVYIGENKTNITIRPNFNIIESELKLLSSKTELKEKIRNLKKGDVVFICSRSFEHTENLLTIFDSSVKNILIIIEKPLATNQESLAKISDLKNNNNIYVISQFRASKSFYSLDQIITRKTYGDLISFSFLNHEAIQTWHPWENYLQSYSTIKSLGGGCLLTQIHDLDILYSLIGLPAKSNFFIGDGNNLRIDVDDYYLGSFWYDTKPSIFGSISSSYYCFNKTKVHSFIFEKAFIKWDLNLDILEINNKKYEDRKLFERNELFKKIAKEIINISNSLESNQTYKSNKYSGLVKINDSFKLLEWLFVNTKN